jgi:hypothetical protein
MSASRKLLRLLLVNALPEQLFDSGVDTKTARRLFGSFVKLVEIENHSYCNRVCWFCPNANYDRRGSITPIDGALYEKILTNLSEIEYSQTLVWARYHEPLAHDSIYGNLKMARSALPRAFLTIHTNGDYLNRDSIKRLEDCGLDQARINLYVANGQSYTQEAVNQLLDQLLGRSGLAAAIDGSSGQMELKGSSVQMPLAAPDFSQGMSSRGGALVSVSGLKQYQRMSACFSPLQHVVIDFNGKGMLCCQVRSDVPEHGGAVVGDLTRADYTLFDFYRDLAGARRALLQGGAKEGVCRTCTVNLGGPDKLGRQQGLATVLDAFGASALTEMAWSRRARRYDPSAS